MCMNNYAHTFANTAENGCFTLMRSIPASILSCSTSFLAWAILLVVDILIHQNTPTQEKTEGVKKQNVQCVWFTSLDLSETEKHSFHVYLIEM